MNINGQFFLLQKEVKMVLNQLSDSQSGKLFKLIAEYVNCENNDEFDKRLKKESVIVQVCFLPIRATIDRNENKYRLVHSQKSEAGRKSGEVRRQKLLKQKPTQTNSVQQCLTQAKSVEHNRSISISRSITQSVCEDARTEPTETDTGDGPGVEEPGGGGRDPDAVGPGDELHQELVACPQLCGMTWEQDLIVRRMFAAAPVKIDWPAVTQEAITAAMLMTSIDNPATFWRAQVDRHVRRLLGPVEKFEKEKTGGVPREVFRGAEAEYGGEED